MTATLAASHPPTRLVVGSGSIERIGELALESGARRVLLVTDAGLVACGHVERVEGILAAAGLECVTYAEVRSNPTTLDVERCAERMGEVEPDHVIGLGGGSAIDVAKGALLVHAGGGRMLDYRGLNHIEGELLPLLAIPTTAGTGSEVQSFAILSDEETHAKLACGDPKAAPRLALLDAELSLTLSHEITACTGLDAIGHAVETSVTTEANEASLALSLEAFRLGLGALERLFEDGSNLEARGDMLLAATRAGLAIEHSMLGAAHATANPLTARFGIVHGQAVATMLPHVVRFNGEDPGVARGYARLTAAAGIEGDAVDRLAERLSSLLVAARFPARLRDSGVARTDLDALAQDAVPQWTGSFNPRPVNQEILRGLYERAW